MPGFCLPVIPDREHCAPGRRDRRRLFGDRRAVARHELVQALPIVGGDPARELDADRIPADLQPIFVGEPHLQDIELQRTDNTHQSRRAVGRRKHLGDAFFGQLVAAPA